jgi:methylated-DNA-[protein]-cysteine S-methyltransferase
MQPRSIDVLASNGAAFSSFSVFPTELGWIALVTRDKLVERLSFGHRTPMAAAHAIGCELHEHEDRLGEFMTDLTQRLTDYAEGAADDFLDVPTDTAHLSPFSAAVVEAVRRIPVGETRSYGQIAALAGRPRAARPVGRVMAENRTPLIVPCHRVVASGGKLGGFSAGDGLSLKRRLLALEARTIVSAPGRFVRRPRSANDLRPAEFGSADGA